MQSKNLLSLIRARKPRAALFTTFTLSLSFFESVFLPVLRQVGCRDISILVDAGEARLSVRELQARQAGRSYWVVPVSAPQGGIFHPKLAYLSSEDEDLLVVGSGNLTLPGQSSQLETIDAVTSSAHPATFSELALMLEALAKAISASSPQASALMGDCARRAKGIARGAEAGEFNEPRDAYLVHTVGRNAADRIAALWADREVASQRLTVLSPYHAPDAGPILRLAKRLEAEELVIGLDPKSKVAPFDAAKLDGERVSKFVEPVVSNPRALHAKVFEVRGEAATLLVTGSVNATHQSLETQKNVEVSLARWLAQPAFEWHEVVPAGFEPNRFTPPDAAAGQAYLDAVLEGGSVRGRLVGGPALPVTVEASFVGDDQVLAKCTNPVEVSSEGHFEFAFSGELACDAAIQLVLRYETLEARGWLNIVEDLVVSDEVRRERQAVAHILRGEFDLQDVAQLLGLLSRIARPEPARTEMPADGKAGNGVKDGPSEDKSNPEFTYQQWQDSGRGFRSTQGDWTRNALALKAFLRWLNVDVVTPPDGSPAKSVPDAEDRRRFRPLEENHPSGKRETASEGVQQSLSSLVQAIPAVLERSAGSDHGPLLAMVAGAYALKLALTSMLAVADATSPMMRWLAEYSKYDYAEHRRVELAQCALGIAIVTGAMWRRANLAVPAPLLRENLSAFFARASGGHRLQISAEEALSSEVFLRVGPDLRAMSGEVLAAINAAATLDELIVGIVESIWGDRLAPCEADVASLTGIHAALRRQWKAKLKRPGDAVITRERALYGCPFCSRALPESTGRILRSRHVAVCPESICGRVMFFLEDESVARRVVEALSRA